MRGRGWSSQVDAAASGTAKIHEYAKILMGAG
jgi:hypothetical protein